MEFYAMYISLRRYDFVAKMIKNGRWEVKNILVRKWLISRFPGKRNQITGGIIPLVSWLA